MRSWETLDDLTARHEAADVIEVNADEVEENAAETHDDDVDEWHDDDVDEWQDDDAVDGWFLDDAVIDDAMESDVEVDDDVFHADMKGHAAAMTR